MKQKVLSCIIIGVLLFAMVPAAALGANYITQTVYEFNGTADGWGFYNNSATFSSAHLLDDGFNMLPYNGKIFYYNAVTNCGDIYSYSFDLEMSDSNAGNTVSVYFNSSSEYVGHRLDLQLKNTSTGNVWGRVCDMSDYNTRNNSIASLDFTAASDDFKAAINNNWHVEIKYNIGNIEVWLRPLSYTGDALKVVDYETTSSSYRKGKIGFKSNIGNYTGNVCKIRNVKVVAQIDATFLEVYKLNGSTTNWILTGGANFNSGTSISNSWSNLNTSAFYRGHWASGTYKFTITSKNDGSAASNLNYIYFNYKDGKNYYRINQPGIQTGGDTLSIKLYEVVDGNSTLIGTYEAPHANRSLAYTIIQQDGKIKITYTSGSQLHEPFEEFDAKLSEGFIGMGTSSTSGAFSGIALYGKADPVWLEVEDCDVTNNSENIPISDFSCTFDFNYDLDISTVTKDAVFVRVKDSGEKLPESAYEIEYSAANSPDCVTIKIKETLEYKTAYEVVVGSALHSEEYGSSLNVKEHVLGFTTIPPQFDVNPVLTSGGADVENVFDIAGQAVDFNIPLTNSGSSEQPFIASVCVHDADGKLVAGKFYKGTVIEGTTDSTTVVGNVTVPSGISEGAKIIIYVWDKPETMNVLYKCIEY